jgi:hypothetical protein
MKRISLLSAIALCIFCSCGNQNSGNMKNETTGSNTLGNNTAGTNTSSNENFVEGKDYQLYERVRLMDKVGFTEPAEAYSILLPKGWTSDGDIVWNQPGANCAGTYKKLKASSPDGKYVFEMMPDVLYSWHSNPDIMQFQPNSGNCLAGQPMKADAYLRNVLVQELGGAEVTSVEENAAVVDYMRQGTQKAMAELQQYGAGQMQVEQSAINGKLKYSDGSEGMVTLGINSIYSTVPNVYDGSSSQFTTSQVMQRTIFKYPAGEGEQAKKLFSLIMSSFRTNPSWNDAVNNFWKEARQRSHTVHLGRIKMIDEQTRRIGEQAIRNGQQRLASMDNQMRSWEQSQSSQDRSHTEFIKTIREVENFRDETGKYEMTAGYNHVWSRGDGNSFILSDNPNFNAASVLQDQNWKKMQKVH